MNEILDRKRGSLIGLAVEFRSPGTFPEVTGYRGGGPHGLGPGEWTDDTSMALALADSIAEVGWDINDQAERYIKWWRTGAYSVNGRCFDIGNTTIAALHRFQSSGDARTSGDRSERASGNGSIMRLAPVPIRYSYMFPNGIGDLVERAVESSLPTHASPQCLSACVYMTVVLCGLLDGRPREEVLDRIGNPYGRPARSLRFIPRSRKSPTAAFAESDRQKLSVQVTSSSRWRPPFGHSTTRRTSAKPFSER